MGGKGRDLTVYKRPDGNWVNKRNDTDKASSLHSTQAEAARAAKAMLTNRGGGDLAIKGTYEKSGVRTRSRPGSTLARPATKNTKDLL